MKIRLALAALVTTAAAVVAASPASAAIRPYPAPVAGVHKLAPAHRPIVRPYRWCRTGWYTLTMRGITYPPVWETVCMSWDGSLYPVSCPPCVPMTYTPDQWRQALDDAEALRQRAFDLYVQFSREDYRLGISPR